MSIQNYPGFVLSAVLAVALAVRTIRHRRVLMRLHSALKTLEEKYTELLRRTRGEGL